MFQRGASSLGLAATVGSTSLCLLLVQLDCTCGSLTIDPWSLLPPVVAYCMCLCMLVVQQDCTCGSLNINPWSLLLTAAACSVFLCVLVVQVDCTCGPLTVNPWSLLLLVAACCSFLCMWEVQCGCTHGSFWSLAPSVCHILWQSVKGSFTSGADVSSVVVTKGTLCP